jgi:hypothetical protein
MWYELGQVWFERLPNHHLDSVMGKGGRTLHPADAQRMSPYGVISHYPLSFTGKLERKKELNKVAKDPSSVCVPNYNDVHRFRINLIEPKLANLRQSRKTQEV